jgi:hypothetical protein
VTTTLWVVLLVWVDGSQPGAWAAARVGRLAALAAPTGLIIGTIEVTGQEAHLTTLTKPYRKTVTKSLHTRAVTSGNTTNAALKK